MFQHMREANKESGQSMVEFALIAAILAMLLVGIIEFGMIFATHSAVVSAAREGARVAARGGIDKGYYNEGEVINAIIINNPVLRFDSVEEGGVVKEDDGGVIYWDVTGNGSSVTSSSFDEINPIPDQKLRDLALGKPGNPTVQDIYLDGKNAAQDTLIYPDNTDRFVVVEIFYRYKLTWPWIAGKTNEDPYFFMYEYAIMPVAAPS